MLTNRLKRTIAGILMAAETEEMELAAEEDSMLHLLTMDFLGGPKKNLGHSETGNAWEGVVRGNEVTFLLHEAGQGGRLTYVLLFFVAHFFRYVIQGNHSILGNDES
jgi:hypothetical protein